MKLMENPAYLSGQPRISKVEVLYPFPCLTCLPQRFDLTELEAADRLGYLATRLNHSARQEHPEDSDCDGDLLRRGAAVVLPESLQEASCPPHIQSPSYLSRILWPLRPAKESESRIGPIRRALIGTRCDFAAGEVGEVRAAPSSHSRRRRCPAVRSGRRGAARDTQDKFTSGCGLRRRAMIQRHPPARRHRQGPGLRAFAFVSRRPQAPQNKGQPPPRSPERGVYAQRESDGGRIRTVLGSCATDDRAAVARAGQGTVRVHLERFHVTDPQQRSGVRCVREKPLRLGVLQWRGKYIRDHSGKAFGGAERRSIERSSLRPVELAAAALGAARPDLRIFRKPGHRRRGPPARDGLCGPSRPLCHLSMILAIAAG